MLTAENSGVAVLKWFCERCELHMIEAKTPEQPKENKIDEMIELMEMTLNRFNGLEDRVNDGVKETKQLEARLKQIEEKMSDNVIISSVEKASEDCVVKANTNDSLIEMIEEKFEIEKRKKNIIVYKVPEGITGVYEDRRKEDCEYVNGLGR